MTKTMHPTFLGTLLALLSITLPVSAGQPDTSAVGTEPDRPNIVLIISDDQSWTDYGFMGHPEIRTPNLDQLAKQSVLFKRGYVPVALCRPSLATLITGMYPHQHGITGNDPAPDPALSSEAYAAQRAKLIAKLDLQQTLPKLLAQRGYVSHQSGKWWEGSYARGGFTEGMTRGFPKKGGRHGDDGLAIGRQGLQPVFDFVDRAVAEQKPFFVWYAPFLPHTPHNPPKRLLDHYRELKLPPPQAKYFAMCEWFDETCGQLLDHLEKTGIGDDTLVVYVTDNGWIQRTPKTKVPDGWRPSFAPRSKQSPYEGGTRTPILFRWPTRFGSSERSETISSIDLMPTLLAAAGAEIPAKLPGINLLPTLADDRPIDRDAIFGESFAHDIADLDNREASLLYRWVIEDQWKLLLTYDGKTKRYQALHRQDEKRPQLFNLATDPHENKNLAADNPAIVKRLSDRLDDWWPVTERNVLKKWPD